MNREDRDRFFLLQFEGQEGLDGDLFSEVLSGNQIWYRAQRKFFGHQWWNYNRKMSLRRCLQILARNTHGINVYRLCRTHYKSECCKNKPYAVSP